MWLSRRNLAKINGGLRLFLEAAKQLHYAHARRTRWPAGSVRINAKEKML
jgi:hypothetical protein